MINIVISSNCVNYPYKITLIFIFTNILRALREEKKKMVLYSIKVKITKKKKVERPSRHLS